MIDRIVTFSLQYRLVIVLIWLILIGLGLRAATELPIDAVPDVTTNQVQINTRAPGFGALEMERYVTVPLEVALSSLPKKEEVRSISQFGLSQVTITFPDDVDLYWARQQVLERLQEVREKLPPGLSPELAPVATGLGEIYQFCLEKENGQEYTPEELTELHTLLEWFIKAELRDVPGVIEVNAYGGYDKQFVVEVRPAQLVAYQVTLPQLVEALEKNNANAAGGYYIAGQEQILIRGLGLMQSVQDIENVVVTSSGGRPVLVKDLAAVRLGSSLRAGAATHAGHEAVLGIAVLLKGENSRTVTHRVQERMNALAGSLPQGIRLEPVYDRSELVDLTIHTAARNLIEGGVLVVVVLFLFLLQLRAGLIVSSAIPLSMLVAVLGMRQFGVSANLMSLGAIDFGLIVDAAVIIVENCVRRLAERRHQLGRPLTEPERQETIALGTLEVRRASQFGELIILSAYLPILALSGLEGKMFRPMALTVIMALLGALFLSLTLIPALCSFFLKAQEEARHGVLDWLSRRYETTLHLALRHRLTVVLGSLGLVVLCALSALTLGSEFLPELDEGAIAINHRRLPSVSLDETVRQTRAIEHTLMAFPEVRTVLSRIGRPEIATDPMGPDMVDTYVMLKPRDQWSGESREELVEKISQALSRFPGIAFSYSQPIKFRMAELIEGIGVRSDVAVKIYGDDPKVLAQLGQQVAAVLRDVPGAADVHAEEGDRGLPVLQIEPDRAELARYGLNIADLNQVIEAARVGIPAGTVLEGYARFDLVVRLSPAAATDLKSLGALELVSADGQRIPLDRVARLQLVDSPAVAARENGRRRSTVECNVRGRDLGSFVDQAQRQVRATVKLPSGYTLHWAGTFENLESGRNRLLVVVPLTFLLIFVLLYTTFGSIREAALVFTGIPLALTGAVLALLLTGMPFSMSAGIGFVAVSGVSVLNGLVMLSFIQQLRKSGLSAHEAVLRGSLNRLRPVLMTATVASIGFLPMALSHGAGSEVQKPLAVVVIGGILTSTLLTLYVLPVLYTWTAATFRLGGSHD